MTEPLRGRAGEAEGARLRPTQGLQFRIGAAFLLVAAVLVTAAYFAGRTLVQSRLVDDALRQQQDSGLRLADAIAHELQLAQILANSVALLAGGGADADWTARIPALAAGSGLDGLLAGLGWWPQPASERAPRRSRFWLTDGVGGLQVRDDYNDPRVVPYWQESWYTPASHAPAGQCHWTPLRREALTQRSIAACTLPVRRGDVLVGAVTVLIDTAGLEQALRQASGEQNGYAVLVDRHNAIIALTGAAGQQLGGNQRPQNLAQLAQQRPEFNTLALEMHRRDEAFLSRAVQSPLYSAAQISQLRDATREGSRQDAESTLALIWNRSGVRTPVSPMTELALPDDTLLGDHGAASVFEIDAAYWKLIRVIPATAGMAGAQYFFVQTLLVTAGLLAATLLLAFAAIRLWLLRPLARMATALSDSRAAEQSLHVTLDAAAPSELGVIGHWYNERARQLRDALDRVMSQQSQLIVEAGERGRADEQALRLRERSHALMGAVSDAVVVVDARGNIEDMNTAAERLTGAALRNALGRPAHEVLPLRLANQGGAAPDLAAGIIASSSRVEYSDGLFLFVEGRSEREIHLSGLPLRGPGERALGAVLVFRPRESVGVAPRVVIDRRSVDNITGLPSRAACDRRLRVLIDGLRLQSRTHALMVIDIDRLRAVNESFGQQAGDEVLTGTAELLVGVLPGAEVFRLGGDTFALIAEDTDEETARRGARDLVQALASHRFNWQDRAISVTVSVGLLCFDQDPGHPLELIRRAQDACAAAKAAGRNTFVRFEPGMERSETTVADEALWSRRIRAGMEEGLLHLTTQPIQPADAHLREGSVFEVSLALEDEEGFWAEPETFLPIAERNGMVADVERWALRQTLEHLSRHAPVLERMAFCSLALSPATITDGSTLELLAQAFQQFPQVPPRALCLHLREAVLTDVPAAALSFAEAMRSLGCRVAIDHLAVRGAASTDLLRRLAADYVRLDARHFMDVAGDAVDQVLADSVIRLARSLQRRVIVTDIGNDTARDAWRRLGADYLHGLAVARPSPVIFTAA